LFFKMLNKLVLPKERMTDSRIKATT